MDNFVKAVKTCQNSSLLIVQNVILSLSEEDRTPLSSSPLLPLDMKAYIIYWICHVCYVVMSNYKAILGKYICQYYLVVDSEQLLLQKGKGNPEQLFLVNVKE